ncbi:acetolactate synthase-1/2/3 large subunit [Celeribacter indicus]|nr:acetolactate synthase-1/2/3 large subunit [Celeribacter indicus]
MVTVAEAIAKTIHGYGTEYYFCLTGGDHDFWIALQDEGIRIVNCRSEASAAYMADGYARVAGRPGFVYGQRGPGAANVAASMPDALWAHSPVIALTSSIFRRSRDRFEYQDVDTLPMYQSVTRWNRELHVPQRAAEMVHAAVNAATGPVPGPVHLEVPADLLPQDAQQTRIGGATGTGALNSLRIVPDRGKLAEALALLGQAERPLIIAGNGVVSSRAFEAMAAFAAASGIPVATTTGGKGAIDERDPLSVGVIGRYSRKVSNEILADADVVLAIGTRLGGLATAGWTVKLDGKTLLQIDTNPEVFGRNYDTGMSILADARLALETLTELRSADAGIPRPDAWAKAVAERIDAWREVERDNRKPLADGMHPAAVIAALREVMAEDDILAADTGAIAAWAGALFPIAAGHNFIRSAGSLGWVVPGAMGAALAAPERRTVALTGDGGLLYHIGDLETAVRMNIPVVIVVMNNCAFGSEDHLLKHRWGGRKIPEIVDFHDVDFAAMARSFGVHGATVTEEEDLVPALRAAYAAGGPALVDIRISKEAEAPHDFPGSPRIV